MLSLSLAVVLVSVAAAVPLDAPLNVERGREIFMHSWTPNDPYANGGDGVGPYFNASSCVECHSSGGAGGAGAGHNNVTIYGGQVVHKHRPVRFGFEPDGLGSGGVRASRSETSLPVPSTRFFPVMVYRNTPALFGAGLIDAIPDDVIEAGASTSIAGHPEITGRVGRSADGFVARFGWKGDVADLDTFVARACSVEVGLEVPGSPQPGPRRKDELPRLDLGVDDLENLVAYVAALPKPEEQRTSQIAQEGAELFDSIGCTGCHKQALGDVDGIYSDLLVHDMGDQLDDVGAGGYYGAPSTTQSREWRTTPLWGVRDSGPWLHDGRAPTLQYAIEAHEGEARKVRDAWRKLGDDGQAAIIAFLESLTAPSAEAQANVVELASAR